MYINVYIYIQDILGLRFYEKVFYEMVYSVYGGQVKIQFGGCCGFGFTCIVDKM